MKKRNYILLIMLLSIFSCTNNEGDFSIQFIDNSELCQQLKDELDPHFSGVWCCIQRNNEANEDNLIKYEYNSVGIDNITGIPDTVFEWEVVSGEIEIVSESNSKKVVILLKQGLTTAELRCTSYDNGPGGTLCAERVTIQNQNIF